LRSFLLNLLRRHKLRFISSALRRKSITLRCSSSPTQTRLRWALCRLKTK